MKFQNHQRDAYFEEDFLFRGSQKLLDFLNCLLAVLVAFLQFSSIEIATGQISKNNDLHVLQLGKCFFVDDVFSYLNKLKSTSTSYSDFS